MNFSEKLILALDFENAPEAIRWVEMCLPFVKTFKVGLGLFTQEGPSIVREIQNRGGKVFLDLKFHDIPNSVCHACEAVRSLNVFMLNVHCIGGVEMMKRASEVFKTMPSKPLLIGVTILTSLPSSEKRVLDLGNQAKEAGLDGVVCSVKEVKSIKSKCGKTFITVTPGIRLEESSVKNDDQKRSSTIQEALASDSDFLVLGRSLFQSKDPLKFLKNTIEKFSL